MTTYTLTGTCYDINGAIVSGATVHVFDTATDTEQAEVTSDGSGVYIADALAVQGPLYAVAYHANSPDIAGTTVNTLLATENVADTTDDDDWARWMQAA